MADELTDAAKKEIADAIRIVREDRFEAYVRERMTKETTEPPKNDPPKDGPTPPPPVPQPENPAPEAPKKRGLWWGETDE